MIRSELKLVLHFLPQLLIPGTLHVVLLVATVTVLYSKTGQEVSCRYVGNIWQKCKERFTGSFVLQQLISSVCSDFASEERAKEVEVCVRAHVFVCMRACVCVCGLCSNKFQ